MAKTSAKANPQNQDDGDRNRGSEPGQEQLPERRNRQNTGNAGGTNVKAANQGRKSGQGQARDKRSEKGDARRSRHR